LTSLNLINFIVESLTDMSNMFNGCTQLKSIDLSSFNTIRVKYMSQLFKNCSRLSSLDLIKFNTINVVDMSSVFYGCSNLNSINFNFLTDKAQNMNNMFSFCTQIKNLDLTNFNTENCNSFNEYLKIVLN
jgi:surface protein